MFRFRRKKKSSDPLAVVQRFVDAANRHDAQGIAECLHVDFDSVQPIYPSRSFRGSAQVRRNWQAIFQSEPGFRLTLLRSASTDDTVWVELHGAGRDAEVAGVFIMGVENDLIRWARVYSAVVDQEVQGPSETGERPPPARAAARVSDAEMAAELREMVDAGRLRVSAPLAPEAGAGADDSLGTGEHPVIDDGPAPEEAVVGPRGEPQDERWADEAPVDEAPVDETPVDETPVDDTPVDDGSVDEAPPPGPGRESREMSLDDLLGDGTPSEPPVADDEPVVELVRPAPGDDDGPAGDDFFGGSDEGQEGEPAVLELKPERRFGRAFRRS
jgi:hypothetical protein